VEADRIWLILAAVFFAVGVVASLGERVFPWWREPGEVLAVGSFLLSAASIGWNASSKQVRRMAGQTALLREVVASFRTRPGP
jgi:predicted negative regulator of RcsB-dependent stress response